MRAKTEPEINKYNLSFMFFTSKTNIVLLASNLIMPLTRWVKGSEREELNLKKVKTYNLSAFQDKVTICN